MRASSQNACHARVSVFLQYLTVGHGQVAMPLKKNERAEATARKFPPILGLSNHQRKFGHSRVQDGPLVPKNILKLGIVHCGPMSPEMLPEPLSPTFHNSRVEEGAVFPKTISALAILSCGF